MPERPTKKNILFPDDVILRTRHFTVAQDWEVPIKGFYVIGSNQHHRSIVDFNDAELLEYGRLQILIRRSMKTKLGISDAYFFQNEDSDHGFHLWIFPRHEWMKKLGKKIESVRPIMEFAVKHHATKKRIADIRRANKEMKRYLSDVDVQYYLSRDLFKDSDRRSERRISETPSIESSGRFNA